jgi:imidazolonepropionase-like amidohydrolase
VFLDEGREQFCPTGHVEKVRKTRDEVAKRLSRLIKHGVKYAIGSDAYHGLLYKDVQYVHSLGATKLEALQGVTVHAAELLGLKDTIGVIKPGAAADIITVDGNPLEDLSALSRVGFVMKGGVVIKN